jgi:competence protein ComEA
MYGGMTRNEVRTMLALLLVITAGMGLRAYRDHAQRTSFIELEKVTNPLNASYHPDSHSPPQAYTPPQNATPAPTPSPDMYAADGRLDLNRANIVALDALPRIGEVRAQAILQYRKTNGPFTDTSQLLKVHGIGEKTLKLLEPLVLVEQAVSTPATEETSLSSSPFDNIEAPPTPGVAPSPTPEAHANPGIKTININTATAEELQSLWNIGPAKAGAIVEYRSQHGLFRTVEDLKKVSGIGPATFDRNRNKMRVSDK